MKNEVASAIKLDAIDRGILELLQDNARSSVADLARRLDVPASTVAERIKRLEARGVIRGYHASVDPVALGLEVTAFILMSTTDIARENELEEALLALPDIQEIHKIAGEDAFLLKVRARSNAALGEMLRKGVEHAGVRSVRTTIVLATARERSTIFIRGQHNDSGDRELADDARKR
jgi:Lrp/AsnC family leucine-responsive transcriptional regulator